ncbi:MAG: monofunctional biosynthetic peptidoglycan transglycosylase [Lysobacter sp.]|nr:monofunctional biosynthetic peptidoglycan transglycosylase [Lysobacter sp.]
MSGDRKRARQAGRREPSRARRWLRRLLWLPVLFVGATVLQVLVLRFVDPPFSAFMAERQLAAWVEGDWDYRTAYDWRDLGAMAPSLPLALVAAEDQRFPVHHGFDFEAIRQAQVHNERMQARAERRNQPVRHLRGASTISQQTAKNLFLWQGEGASRWLRKGLEAWYTVLMEAFWPKARILEVYANIAEFGDGIYGAQAASRSYFGKDAVQLTPAESASLAAVLPSPRRYSAGRPGPYVERRSGGIQRQMRHLGRDGVVPQR